MGMEFNKTMIVHLTNLLKKRNLKPATYFLGVRKIYPFLSNIKIPLAYLNRTEAETKDLLISQ